MGTDQGVVFSETRFSSDRTVVFEDNDEGYGSTRITFTAMFKDDLRDQPTVNVEDVGSNDSLSRIIDDCFNNKYKQSVSLNLPSYVKSCRIDSGTNSSACTTNRIPGNSACTIETVIDPLCATGTPLDPVCASRTPIYPVCTTGTPTDPVCATRTPIYPVCATGTPTDPVCATRTPIYPVCTTGTPTDPVCATRTPIYPVCTAGTPIDSACTTKTPIYPGCTTETAINTKCTTPTSPDAACSSRNPIYPACTSRTPPTPSQDSGWRTHKIQVVDETDGRTDARKDAGSTRTTSNGVLGGSAGIPWRERKTNIDNALSWLRSELEGMRVQDKLLLNQLQRCRETIDTLKQQRCSWDDGSDDGDLDEEEEDHWEDWEIAEYERKYAANREFSLDSEDSREKCGRDLSDTSSSRSSRDCLENLSSRNSIDSAGTVTETPRHTGTQCADRMSRRSQSIESSASSAGSLMERRVTRKFSESSSSGSTKGLYFRQDIEVTV